MDIGLVKRSFRLQGGGERQIGYLIEGLLAQGHRVYVFGEQLPATAALEGLIYHHLPALPIPRAFRALGFAMMVQAALRRAGLAVVQSFDRTLGQQIYRVGEGVHREWLRRKRRALSILGRGWSHLDPFDHVMLALERKVFFETPFMVTNSQQSQAEVVHHYGISHRRMLTIYNGVDTARFHPGVRQRFGGDQRAVWGVSANELVLLYVGSGFLRKGLAAIIEALALLRVQGMSHVRLVVVGKGRLSSYQRQARRLAVSDLVQWEGHRTDVERCYAGADLFVLPTLYDPFANTCLEAMACGLPVVTTAANGAAELLQDGISGYVLRDTSDVEALADILRRVLHRHELRRAMAEAAARTAQEHPLSRALTETVQVYEAVATPNALV